MSSPKPDEESHRIHVQEKWPMHFKIKLKDGGLHAYKATSSAQQTSSMIQPSSFHIDSQPVVDYT